jgi:hypothetical protein
MDVAQPRKTQLTNFQNCPITQVIVTAQPILYANNLLAARTYNFATETSFFSYEIHNRTVNSRLSLRNEPEDTSVSDTTRNSSVRQDNNQVFY